ncbi:hypothetical protein D1BOALGB6SA_824 [Olavius sp. associated proteobacterium Delta 1]|nr:hypothetical protein D1BOALGB6SA_824 [Olavius sp. associated proteobacterium Delta 1]
MQLKKNESRNRGYRGFGGFCFFLTAILKDLHEIDSLISPICDDLIKVNTRVCLYLGGFR